MGFVLIHYHTFKEGKLLSKKQFVWNIISFLLILTLSILAVDMKSNQDDMKSEINKWKSIAKSEQEVPKINEEAKSFIKALNKASHQKYLTGEALEDYEREIKEHSEEAHMHGDTGEQTINILQVNTEKTEQNQAESVILYQVLYKSPFDSEEAGVIDQRVLTLLLNIDWKKEENKYKVNKYELQLLQDNLDEYLSSLSKKGDGNE